MLLLLLFVAVDAGRLFFTYIEINNAAREAANYGAQNPGDSAAIEDRALQETNAQSQRGETAPTVTASCADGAGTGIACTAAAGGGGSGNTITVRVEERFNLFTPLIGSFFNNNLRIGAAATAAVFVFAPTGGGAAPSQCAAPTSASFTVSTAGLTLSVDASASEPSTGPCAISGYDWDWGDGVNLFPPIAGKQVSYTYAGSGTYTVQLTVSNPGGELTTSQAVPVGTAGSPSPSPSPTPTPTPSPSPSPSPTCNYAPDFSWQSDNKNNPTLTFQGSYTGLPAPTSWSWDFDNNGINDGTGQNTSHKYTGNPSNVTAKLTIQGPSCPAVSVTHVVIP